MLFVYILLFVSLVFYLQTVRYLMWLNNLKLNFSPLTLLYINYNNAYLAFIVMVINIFGIVLLDDLFILALFYSFY